jgi:hypothetical protein
MAENSDPDTELIPNQFILIEARTDLATTIYLNDELTLNTSLLEIWLAIIIICYSLLWSIS